MESRNDDSPTLAKSWLNVDIAGQPYWPTVGSLLADLKSSLPTYLRAARRRQRLTFDDVRELRRLLAVLADVESKQKCISAEDRRIYKDGSKRLQTAFAELVKVEGLNVVALHIELRQPFSPAWCAWLRLTLTKADEYGARGTFLDVVEAAHCFTSKARSRARLTPDEVDRLRSAVKSRIPFRTQIVEPNVWGYRRDGWEWHKLEDEFEVAFRRLGRLVPLLSERFGVSPGSEWAARGDLDTWDSRGGDPLGPHWRYLDRSAFWDEFMRRAEGNMKNQNKLSPPTSLSKPNTRIGTGCMTEFAVAVAYNMCWSRYG